METGVLASEVGGLERLDRRDRLRGDDADLMRDAGDDLQGVQKSGRGRSEQLRGAARDERAVRKLDRGSGSARLLGPGQCRGDDAAVGGRYMSLLHDELDLVGLLLAAGAVGEALKSLIVAADDLLAGCLAADLVVRDAAAGHVDAHVGGGFVFAFAVDIFKDRLQNREGLDIAVVVDRGDIVGFEVEGIDHVEVV